MSDQDAFEEKDVARSDSNPRKGWLSGTPYDPPATPASGRLSDSECLQSMERSLRSLRRIAMYFLWLSIVGLILGLIAFTAVH
jgi:hypothetical protein